MNDEHRQILSRAMERGRRAIEALEREKPPNAEAEIASYRAELEMLQNEEFMEGFFESLEAVRRGERAFREAHLNANTSVRENVLVPAARRVFDAAAAEDQIHSTKYSTPFVGTQALHGQSRPSPRTFRRLCTATRKVSTRWSSISRTPRLCALG
jgi:hypothetical protein